MSKSNSNEFIIDPGMFKSVELNFSIENSTTRTTVNHAELIKLIQFLEKGMVLEIPSKSCSKGHNLIIKINVLNSNKVQEFDTTAKVVELDTTSKESDTIVVNLTQYDGDTWVQLQSIYSSRQDDIEKFLQAARGW